MNDMHRWVCLQCRLVDFSVVDEAGEQQPLESHGVRQTQLFLSGEIFALGICTGCSQAFLLH